jgi:hypothetical protein
MSASKRLAGWSLVGMAQVARQEERELNLLAFPRHPPYRKV